MLVCTYDWTKVVLHTVSSEFMKASYSPSRDFTYVARGLRTGTFGRKVMSNPAFDNNRGHHSSIRQ
jgi:hypothetical protein